MAHLRFIFVVWGLLFSLPVLAGVADYSAQPAYYPPATNPHPPLTETDKRRVAFADLVIRRLLTTAPTAKTPLPVVDFFSSQNSFDVSEKCLSDATCLDQNTALMTYVDAIKQQYRHFTDIRHVHIIPWSMEKYLKSSSAGTLQKDPKQEYSKSMAATMVLMSAPVQKDDEFMFHTYVMNAEGTWYHLDVYVTEDAQGRLRFRRFFLTPAQTGGSGIPAGAEC